MNKLSSSDFETWSSNLDFNNLINKHGSPIYVFNIPQLKINFETYRYIVGKSENIAYPVKSNPSIAVLREIEKLGGSVDCASMSEVKLALLTGFNNSRIIYNSPSAELSHLITLLKNGSTVVIDSVKLLKALNDFYELKKDIETGTAGKVFLRINPEIPIQYAHQEDWQELTAHGSSTSKFGIPSEEIIPYLLKMRIPITGLHTHVGTMMDNLESFKNIVKFLHNLVDKIHFETEHKIDNIDIGGGLGLDFTNNDEYPSIEALFKVLKPLFRKKINYIVEPGHSLVGNAMGLLAKVTDIKKIRNKKWAILDVGSDQFIKITLLKWAHRILDSKCNPLPFDGPDSVGGPLCFSGDIFLNNTSVESLYEGSPVFIQHTGAYCYALGNHFNGRKYIGMIKIDDNNNSIRCNYPENDFFSPNYFTHAWENDYSNWKQSKNLSVDLANKLNSNYLQTISLKDKYEIISFEQINENSYRFGFKVTADVDFISMPFAVRIVGDATIVSILHRINKKVKDISIWSDRLVLESSEIISPNRDIVVKTYLSEISSRKKNNDKMVIVRFSMDNDKFTGYFSIKFSL